MALFFEFLREHRFPLFTLGSVGVLVLSFSLATIKNYITADEHFWLPNYGTERVQDYWRAVEKGDWEDTQINDKPGVTLAYLSGIALPFATDLIKKQIVFQDGTVTVFDPSVTRQINFLFRFPLVLFIIFFFLYFYWILFRLTENRDIATWTVILMMLSPVLLGISQIVNPDTLFWVFGSATLLTFLWYLKEEKRCAVWLTALFFGLSLLSKYVSTIFIPFFFLLIGIKFLYQDDTNTVSPGLLAIRIRQHLRSYFTILIGGTLLFCFFMPAALVDPEVLFESTIGFKGMFPIFLSLVGISLLLTLESLFNQSRWTAAALSFFRPYLNRIEKILFFLLLATTLFVLANWMLRNSLHDLSGIPFDAKTKASFTTEHPFIDRYLVEFVPLLFSLTPLSLILFIFFLLQGILTTPRHRFLTFSLSLFLLVFYFAVIDQGLLVTTRYSIILYPIVCLLGAIGLANLLSPSESKKRYISAMPLFYGCIIGILALLQLTNLLLDRLPDKTGDQLEYFIRNHFPLLTISAFFVIFLVIFLSRLFIHRWPLEKPKSLFLTLGIIGVSLVSLFLSYPHYFVYVNMFLPKKYLISGSWGYGGYEVAQYLNAKPKAKDITLWTDAHGVCEFFVGKCIHKSKVDTSIYSVDYLLRTLAGQLSPKFPFHIEGAEFEYTIGGRKKNFMRLYRNLPEPLSSKNQSVEKQESQ